MTKDTNASLTVGKIKLFLVDDDAVYLKLLEIEFLQHADFEIETYATGEQCIENLSHKPDVIILDYYLDGVNQTAMNGIKTLDKIRAFNSKIPVVMLSCQDKIDIAISCMHHGAFDYVVKSETAFIRLQKIITRIFSYKKIAKQLSWYMERM
ncbi:MAG: response regulator [Flavobacteriales bacterium CG03_land_8_20_14_0_80_35_15]|nr:response regulator [Zetaproteobacteria bacterium]OIO10955.1 MAG: response regulator [Flavobacteriaceae bacterium CG1_02_35_72]PIV17618.1 MAG: response regulator [Flavobacteriales bacterium CG03_land_8_20_14_0_80_35_15]PIX07273.1 MAG: response regulator [Flavobacteriales bacterium CG_4_8_14_3_um_filter_35_10]PJA05232.1 MAG: response regulator [Flavobacteriales bacterium CG_4_10_14_0_2_um_filter_35_18]